MQKFIGGSSGMFPGILEIAEKIHESLENGTTVASIVKTGDGFYSGTSLEYRIPELHASLVIGESLRRNSACPSFR